MRKDIKEIIAIDLKPTNEKILDYIIKSNLIEVITLDSINDIKKHLYTIDNENNVYYSGTKKAHFL